MAAPSSAAIIVPVARANATARNTTARTTFIPSAPFTPTLATGWCDVLDFVGNLLPRPVARQQNLRGGKTPFKRRDMPQSVRANSEESGFISKQLILVQQFICRIAIHAVWPPCCFHICGTRLPGAHFG